MIGVNVHYTDIMTKRLDALLDANRENTRKLTEEIPDLLWEGNRMDRMEGLDASGQALVPYVHRSGPYANAHGPTLAPFGEMSRSISGFYARPVGGVAQGFQIAAGFQGPGVEILAYHAEGKAGNGKKGQVTGIVRNVFGFSDRTRKALVHAFRESASATFAGKVRAGIRAFRRQHYQMFNAIERRRSSRR